MQRPLDFAGSAEEIHLSLEGENLPILRAQLKNVEGELRAADMNLSERIGNNDGHFAFGMFPCYPQPKSSILNQSSRMSIPTIDWDPFRLTRISDACILALAENIAPLCANTILNLLNPHDPWNLFYDSNDSDEPSCDPNTRDLLFLLIVLLSSPTTTQNHNYEPHPNPNSQDC